MRCRGIYVWHRERHDLDGQDFMRSDRPISAGVCLCKSRRCPSRIRADNRYGAARAVLPIASSGPLRLLAAVPKWSCNGRDGSTEVRCRVGTIERWPTTNFRVRTRTLTRRFPSIQNRHQRAAGGRPLQAPSRRSHDRIAEVVHSTSPLQIDIPTHLPENPLVTSNKGDRAWKPDKH